MVVATAKRFSGFECNSWKNECKINTLTHTLSCSGSVFMAMEVVVVVVTVKKIFNEIISLFTLNVRFFFHGWDNENSITCWRVFDILVHGENIHWSSLNHLHDNMKNIIFSIFSSLIRKKHRLKISSFWTIAMAGRGFVLLTIWEYSVESNNRQKAKWNELTRVHHNTVPIFPLPIVTLLHTLPLLLRICSGGWSQKLKAAADQLE